MHRWSLAFLISLAACAASLPDHVDLKPEGEAVEVAVEPPSPHAYMLVGQVVGLGAARDLDVAQQAAKNDPRNKAGALGATLVTIDEDLGEPMPLEDRTR